MSESNLKAVEVWEGRSSTGDPLFPTNPLRLNELETRAVIDYLRNAPIVLRTTAKRRDPIADIEAAVPQSIRSDGIWVWSDEVAYYIETYGFSPGNEFLDHLASYPKPPSLLSSAEYNRIVAALGL